MNYFILGGSHRKDSESGRIADYISGELKKQNHNTEVFKLEQNPIPLFDESLWQDSSDLKKLWEPVASKLQKADAIVLVCPEWAGMATPGVKNFFLFCGTHEVAHKPALLVSVSATRNGAYPISELRMSSYKNNRICFIPEHVIVRDAPEMFKDNSKHAEDNKYLTARMGYALNVLGKYAESLKSIRPEISFKEYGNGM